MSYFEVDEITLDKAYTVALVGLFRQINDTVPDIPWFRYNRVHLATALAMGLGLRVDTLRQWVIDNGEDEETIHALVLLVHTSTPYEDISGEHFHSYSYEALMDFFSTDLATIWYWVEEGMMSTYCLESIINRYNSLCSNIVPQSLGARF